MTQYGPKQKKYCRIVPPEGFALIEILISTAASIVILVAFVTLAIQTKKINRINSEKLKAALYLREMIEVTKDLEISNWDELSNIACLNPLPCHPEISGSAWHFIAGEETLDHVFFRRSLSIFPVYRNRLEFPNEIVLTGGIIDPNTKKASTTISWIDEFGPKTMSLETYLHKP